jgi:hypothetical protein
LIPLFFHWLCKFVRIISILLNSVFITFFQGFLLGDLNMGQGPGSCERILLGSHSPPLSGHLLGPSIGIRVS